MRGLYCRSLPGGRSRGAPEVMPGLLLFVMQGAEQCVYEQPRCGGVLGAHLHRSDHFCRTLWNATSGFELIYTLRLGSRGEPMPTQARKTGVGEARQDRPPAREKHASLSQRSSCCASKRCCLHCCPVAVAAVGDRVLWANRNFYPRPLHLRFS